MAHREAFLINPPRKVRKNHKKKRSMTHLKKYQFKKNPLGEELMFVGLNPFEKGGQSMAHKKHHRKHHKVHSNPKRHRRYHHNPMSSTKHLIPMVISGAAGALAGRVVPQFIPILNGMGTLGNVASKGILAIGGAWILDKTGLGRKMPGIEDGWLIGSLTAAIADLSGLAIVGTMQGLGMIDNQIAPYNCHRIGEFVHRSMGDYSAPMTDDNPYFDRSNNPYAAE